MVWHTKPVEVESTENTTNKIPSSRERNEPVKEKSQGKIQNKKYEVYRQRR